MYCKNCGNEIADNSKFCSYCGTPVKVEMSQQQETSAAATPAEAVPEKAPESIIKPEPTVETHNAPTKQLFEEFQWNVEDYPGRRGGKTEDVNFDWNARPQDVPDEIPRYIAPDPVKKDVQVKEEPQQIYKEQAAPANDMPDITQTPLFGTESAEEESKPLSAADRIDKFYTFNKKNEEFQQLLNREYEKVKSGNAIERELSEAEELANMRFESRPEDSSMEAFLEKEGIVKPYQPKAFESDVLRRIEAQEAEKEAKRREEEARLAAIEEARKAAEAEAKRKAEEEARIAAEEEARRKAEEEARRIEEARLAAEAEAKRKAEEEAARLQEIARRKAEEEAKLAEEARRIAEAEAKRKAEEEARIRAEEEARLRAEAEAKVKAAEEARIKAEADLRAAQEAAKIRAQQEARMAAQAEAKFKADQERRKLEALEAQQRLDEQKRKLADEANEAVAQEAIRKVIEQTARMRDEEAAKIRAAVANMRDGIDNIKEDVENRDVAQARAAAKNQIDEMAKNRNEFFAEFKSREQEEVPEPAQIMPEVEPEAVPSEEELIHTRTVDKAAIMAGLSEDTIVASRKYTAAPESDEDFFNSLDAAAAQAEELTNLEDLGDLEDVESLEAFVAEEEPAQPIDFREEELPQDMAAGVDDLLLQFENTNTIEPSEPIEEEFKMSDTIQAGNLAETFKTEQDSVLNETVVMPHNEKFSQVAAANDFDNYGNEEAANYMEMQSRGRQKSHMDEFYGDGFYEEDDSQLSKKELKRRAKEQKRLEKERAKEAKVLAKRDADFDNVSSREADDSHGEKEGKGRIVLKIVLVVLIVILAVEVVGMGIRFIAPQSKAAEFIDNQLNKVIHLITGEDTEYSVIAAQVRTEPIEDKTDMINSQSSKNADGNIKSIVYSSDLGYDKDTDGKVSDLVLSQPMTLVEWGRDEDNYPIYYDEQVVGAIIAFESNRANLMNKGDEKVLSMIKPDTKLYTETAGLNGKKMTGAFEKLEIGEIRQAGNNYYVWVRETIGGNTAEKVYSMYPEEKFVMKMAASYTV